MNDFELKLLIWVQDIFKCTVLDFFMPLVTRFGDAGIFWITVAVILLFIPKYRKIGITMGVALVVGLLVVNCGLKPLVARVRPYDYLFQKTGDTFALLIGAQSDFSFPSGHTLASFEAATVLFMFNRKFGVAAYFLAVLIAFSRVYLFVHYPSDVLFSVALGIGIAFFARFIVEKTFDRFIAHRNSV